MPSKRVALDVSNKTIRKYVTIAGTLQEGAFEPFVDDIKRGALGRVVDFSAIGKNGESLSEVLESYGLGALYPAAEAAVVYFAFLSALPSLDVNIASSGFTVTNTQGLAPASAARVERLRDDIVQKAYRALGDLYQGGWDMVATRQVEMVFRVDTHRQAICNDLHIWRKIWPLPGSEKLFFERYGAICEYESSVVMPLVGELFYHSLVDDAVEGRRLPNFAAMLREAAVRLVVGDEYGVRLESERAAKRLYNAARSELNRDAALYPLYKNSASNDGEKPPFSGYGPEAGRGMFVA